MGLTLTSEISSLPSVGPAYSKKLGRLGIETIGDLLNHLPSRYLDYSKTTQIATARVGDIATFDATVRSFVNTRTKRGVSMQLVQLEDASGRINAVWFNQPYLISSLKKGMALSVSGKVSWFGRDKALTAPDYEINTGSGIHTGRLVPIYPETKGVSSKWLRGKTAAALTALEIPDFLTTAELTDYGLISLDKAYAQVHFPDSLELAQQARKRLAFNELLLLHIVTLKKKALWERNKVDTRLTVDEDKLGKFITSLPFNLTGAQAKAIEEILADLSGETPMNRLLEGDVGSGKTVVAAAAACIASANDKQTVFMAPTQILANQHYQTLNGLAYFADKVALVTAAGVVGDPKSAQIVVGTHSLLHRKFNLEKNAAVGLVVIDEQQRFGVTQREHLVRKVGKQTQAPHVLTMTATPIPRTVALTFYGDLDVSVLDELPRGRQKITTWVVPESKRVGAFEWMGDQLAGGAQVYVVCPLIDESEALMLENVKSVTQVHKELTAVFPKYQVGLLHGKQSAKAKSELLDEFKSGKIKILVATPVVEVGIDVPNATIMLIESADRFGLSQLHQLRGRVGRGSKKSYCLLFAEKPSVIGVRRLQEFKQTQSGFEIAKLDLELRGPGELFGTAQSGFPELKIASWTDSELIRQTRELAQEYSGDPSKLAKLPDLNGYAQRSH